MGQKYSINELLKYLKLDGNGHNYDGNIALAGVHK